MNTILLQNKIAVIGELNVDLIATGLTTPPTLNQEILAQDFQVVLGSASAIFACGIAKLGYPVTFISQVGTDEFGLFCLKSLREAGVSTDRVIENPALKTGVTISLSTTLDRALVTYLGAIAELKYEHVPPGVFEGHRHLHLTSYFLQHNLRASFPEIMTDAKQAGLTTSFDPNADPEQEWNDEIWNVFAKTDVLFVNESEAMQLTRRRELDEALKVLGQSIACVVVKRGRDGAVAIRNGETASASGFPVETVDTTGAGDSFAAGFLHGYLENHDLRTCLEFGNACGALSTLKAGGTANQPNQTQLSEFLREQQINSSNHQGEAFLNHSLTLNGL